MSKLIVSMMTSVDGFIEGQNGELDWTVESRDFNAYCDDMLDHADTLVFGRVSYQMMETYWPAAETSPRDAWERQFAPKMNARPKLVVSRTLERATWSHTRIVRDGALRDEVQALKRRDKAPSSSVAPASSPACAGSAPSMSTGSSSTRSCWAAASRSSPTSTSGSGCSRSGRRPSTPASRC